MKAFVVVALLSVAASVSAQGGFRSAFSTAGLQNFESAIVAFANAEFQDITLPDMSFDEKLPVIGRVAIDLTDIVVTDFHVPGASFSLAAPNIIIAGVSGTGLTIKMNWKYKQHSWPHISDHGDLTAVPKQGDITINAAMSIVAGHPYFECASCTADFDKIDLHFSGHWDSWLLNFMKDLFAGTIRKSVNDAVSKALVNVVNVSINKVVAKLPNDVYFGGGEARETMNVETVATEVTATYLSLTNAFSVSDNATGAACPIAPVNLPDLDPSSNQLQFYLAESALNCMIWVPFTNGAFKGTFASTVEFWAEFIPQLKQMFAPSDVLNAVLTPWDMPSVTFNATDGIVGSMSFLVQQNVVNGSDTVDADTLLFEASFGIDFHVGTATPKQKNAAFALFGNVTDFQLGVSVYSSNIGPIDLGTLNLIIEVATPVVTAALDAVLAAGVPIPLIPGITLVDPNVFFGAGYFGIGSNFQFNLTANANADADAYAYVNDA